MTETPDHEPDHDRPAQPDQPDQPDPDKSPESPESPEPSIVPLEPPAPSEEEAGSADLEAAAPESEADNEPEPEPEPFADGPPPLPTPMLVLGGDLPPVEEPAEEVDHGTCRCGGKFDADGWCTECGERRPDPRHHFSSQPSPLVAGVCDRGIRHTDNEDAMAIWAEEADPGHAALVVCDGVTTATRSAEASLAAAFAALEVLTTTDDEPTARLVHATEAAAQAVVQVGEDFPDSAPSCTFVAAVVEGGIATVGNIGDSRAYWFPDDGDALLLTRDDSMAQEQIDAGMDRESAESGPLGHTITRWLGPDSPDHDPLVVAQDVQSAGWLLLCSDGLWNYASEPTDLAEVVREVGGRLAEHGADPLDLASALVDWANGRGGADNITVALMRTGVPEEDQPGDSGQDGDHG